MRATQGVAAEAWNRDLGIERPEYADRSLAADLTTRTVYYLLDITKEPELSQDFVSLKQLAGDLGMDRSHTRRYVLRLGIHPKKRRTADSGGQLTLTIAAEEADRVRQVRAEQGFGPSAKPVANDVGYFYIIRLVPELDPNRVKLGFADDVASRLAQHRTAAPTAVLVKAWPCKRSWEGTIMDGLSAVGGRLILNEVFEFDDLDAVIKRGDDLFALLPGSEGKGPIAEASPHREA